MNLRYSSILLAGLLAAPGALRAADQFVLVADVQKETAEKGPRSVELALSPAPCPRPALKYRLLPQYLDQTPGNAAPLYHMAIELRFQSGKPEDLDRLNEWLDLPPAQLPRAEAHELLDRHMGALHQARLGALREYCHWELPVRSEGIKTLLPFLSEMRTLVKLTALQARVALVEGRFDDAFEGLQTGFAMAGHMRNEPLLITSLVGTAAGKVMAREVQWWSATPGAPNLYWALTNLPRPFVDLRRPLEGEAAFVYFEVPELTRIEKPMNGPAANQIAAAFTRISQSGGNESEPDWTAKLGAAVFAAGRYQEAKQRLIASGRKAADIEAMPVQQVVLLDAHEWYAFRRDEVFKWMTLPYWQAQARLRELEQELEKDVKAGRGLPFMEFMPSLQRASFSTQLLDRQLEALRCVEAVRLQAAESSGKLPAALEAITSVPVPIDPMTGQAFEYTVSGDRATLKALAPEGERASDGFQYVLTIRKP